MKNQNEDCQIGFKKHNLGGNRGWDGWMAPSTQWTSLSKLQETAKNREAWHDAVHEIIESDTTDRLNNNTLFTRDNSKI